MVTIGSIKRVPLLSLVFGAVGLMWISISYLQWARAYPDISQLIFGVGLGFGIIYVGYDYWWKRRIERENKEEHNKLKEDIKEKIKDLKDDLKMVDDKVNRLEVSFIEFKNKEYNKNETE